MLLVHDLRIEEDVIPLFNFTHTGQAEAALWDLFRSPPGSITAILEWQHIMRGFRQNWAVVGEFSYSTLYQRETQSFLNNLKNGRTLLESDPIKARIRYLWSAE